jgi:hypothetical protein
MKGTVVHTRKYGLTPLLAIIACAALFAPQAYAQIEVSQESSFGAGDFNSNILGTIDVFDTAGSAAAYYNYQFSASQLTDPTLVSNRSHLFMVNSAVDGLTLFVINDANSDGSSGNATMQVDLSGDPDGMGILVSDDPGEVILNNPFQATGAFKWEPCCTDGMALGTINGDWELLVGFLAPPVGLSDWYAYSSGGSSLPLALGGGAGRVRLQVVPEPGTIALLGIAGMVVMTRRRRRAVA